MLKTFIAAVADRYNVRKMVARSQHQVGATAIEYGLIAAGISVAIIAVVQGLGPKKSASAPTPAITQQAK